jgi:NodT family efflux transporter outer membrane factor (OMF) lipoprotein
LAKTTALNDQSSNGIITPEQISYFIQHYQRLTEQSLKVLPSQCDYLLQLDQTRTATPQQETKWWTAFNDPTLNRLIETAWANNNRLQITGLRVLESRAQLGLAVGSLYPQQAATGGAAYISPPENSGLNSNYWQYSLRLGAAWEIDFWGRFQRGIESANAAFFASLAAYDQALILLSAQVVDTYIILRTIEEQLRISHENIYLQKRSYEITEVLYRNGQASGLDMQQANSLLLSTQSTIPALNISLKQAQNALSVLLGQQPGSTSGLLTDSRGIPQLPTRIAIGLPANMLRQRPDVRQAELFVKSQNALIGLAKADLYPSFSLTGSIGLSAGGPVDDDFDNLFDDDALSYSIGPSFSWPFLSYGRIKNNIRVQDARLQQALVNYRDTVLLAAREAEDAIAGFKGGRQQAIILGKTVTSSKRSNELSTLRFREGFSDYQRVLDSQQALFGQQQRHITSQSDTVRSLVALYKALGGGWQAHEGQPLIKESTQELMRQRTDWGELLETSHSASDIKDNLMKPDW